MRLIKGSLLYTKDGRKIGNGIVLKLGVINIDGKLKALYTVKTDFGNIVRLTEIEIDEFFYLSKLAYADPMEQLKDQTNLLYKLFNDYS